MGVMHSDGLQKIAEIANNSALTTLHILHGLQHFAQVSIETAANLLQIFGA